MRFILSLLLLSVLACGLSSFRLALRVCFKEADSETERECAYCNPRTLLRTMGNCTNTEDGLPLNRPNNIASNVWTETQKRCILRTCRQQNPSQKILPTLFPLQSSHIKIQ